MFAILMLLQWLAGIVMAVLVSPRAWAGTESRIHLHVWAALLLGGVITILPVILAWTQSGKVLTRHVIAVGQMLMSALLIHLTGGRIDRKSTCLWFVGDAGILPGLAGARLGVCGRIRRSPSSRFFLAAVCVWSVGGLGVAFP